jgi:hypothetical protein
MPIVSILTFIATFFFIFLVGLYIFFIFYNKQTKAIINKFIEQANELKPTVFQNINTRYWTTSGLKTSVYPNNHCDLYLFDNCLAIVRKQKFIFKVLFAPILLTSDIATIETMFDSINTYKPDRITFKQTVKGEIDIKLTDLIYKHYKIDMTFKELTNEQMNELEKIKKWC